MRTDYMRREDFERVLSALMPENRLILEVSLYTGLRLSDVLNFRTEKLSERFTVRELKTGKRRVVRLSTELLDRCLMVAGKIWVFEHRIDYRKHRTRQAVFKDIKKVAKMWRIRENIAPHSARKVFAVSVLKKYGSVKKVQNLLNHDDEAVTLLYCLADQITERALKCGRKTQDNGMA